MRLTESTVVDYLQARGVLAPGSDATVEILVGGVSSDVLAVTARGTDVVVKQSLERLRVAAE
ncbi:MAG: phosphotransferase, partial [Actinobacteria bacterium]|nr:phosphotransferase [Actinomycetota bacterium]